MPTSLKYSDLTMREKSAIDALRLLDGESRNREQNFLAIVSGYRARVEELEADNRRLNAIVNGQDSAMVLMERERIVALLLDDKRVQVWIPEAGDLYPVTANDLRKLFQA